MPKKGATRAGEAWSQSYPPPRVFLRKDVKVKELRVEWMQECDSMGLIGVFGQYGGVAVPKWEQTEGVALHTKQYI